MSKPRLYHTLIVRDGSPGCPWGPDFGDYDLQTVKDERADRRDQGFKASELRIITTADSQDEIRDAVREINRKAGLFSEHSEFC